MRLLPCFLLLLGLVLAGASPVFAQADQASSGPTDQQDAADQSSGQDGDGAPAGLPENADQVLDTVAPEQLQGLLDTLRDEAARQGLIDRLEALVALSDSAGEEDEGGLEAVEEATLSFMAEQAAMLGAVIAQVGDALALVPTLPGAVIAAFENEAARDRTLNALWHASLALVIALLVWWLVRRLLLPVRGKLADLGSGRGWPIRAPLLVVRLFVDLVPLAALAGAVVGLQVVIDPGFRGRVLMSVIVVAFLATTVISLVLRFFLSPSTPAFRLLPVSDAGARLLYSRLVLIGAIAAWGYLIIDGMFLFGATLDQRRGLMILLGLAVAILAIVLIFRHRRLVQAWFRSWIGGRGMARSVRLGVIDSWPWVASAYLVIFFLVWAIDMERGFAFMSWATVLTIALVLVARGLAAALDGWQRRVISRLDEAETAHRRERRTAVLTRIGKAIIAFALVVGLIQVWGYDIVGFFTVGFGREILDSIIAIAIILVLSLAAWEVVNIVINRHLRETDEEGNPVHRSARLKTLLPLVRNAMLVLIVTLVVLIMLSEIGIDIAPLLAGAGVVGIALAFGAQTLVADILTGVFILLEDQIQIGDVVDTGSHVGLVEGMTIRTLRLRDLSGVVHIIPFSQVTSIKNMTKDFSYYVFDVGVAYREDTDYVTEIMKEIGAGMREDEHYGPLILDDFEVLGVDAFADSAVVIKARFKTLPVQQWTVGREFNRRMKKRFDELGIEIPFPHTTLYFGVDKQGQAPAANVRLTAPEAEAKLDELAQAEKVAKAVGQEREKEGAEDGGDGAQDKPRGKSKRAEQGDDDQKRPVRGDADAQSSAGHQGGEE
jgi:small conductance mechanosensitive channel